MLNVWYATTATTTSTITLKNVNHKHLKSLSLKSRLLLLWKVFAEVSFTLQDRGEAPSLRHSIRLCVLEPPLNICPAAAENTTVMLAVSEMTNGWVWHFNKLFNEKVRHKGCIFDTVKLDKNKMKWRKVVRQFGDVSPRVESLFCKKKKKKKGNVDDAVYLQNCLVFSFKKRDFSLWKVYLHTNPCNHICLKTVPDTALHRTDL